MLHFHAVARMFWLVARGLHTFCISVLLLGCFDGCQGVVVWLPKCSEWVLACFYVVTWVFSVVARVLLSVATF